MNPTVYEALRAFLAARRTPGNSDLIDRYLGLGGPAAMETQLNVAPGEGEPVAGKRSTWSDGADTWWNIRIPHDANSEPKWDDYKLTFTFDEHAEGIGCTGWDWKALRSRWFGFDFDALTAHAKGVGISPEDLEKVKQAAEQLPYVETRKSTGGGGIHLYVYCDDAGIETKNHTEHAALARCILGMMSSECNFDFASQIDCCGGVMWIWHRKMMKANPGLAIIKPATKLLTEADLPANWRDHIEVVTRKRTKVRINEITDEELDPFEALTSSRRIVLLDDSHKAQIAALQQTHYTTLWVTDHHLLQTHTCALKEVMDSKELDLIGVFETSSPGRNPGSPNCFLFPLLDGGWRVFRFSQGVSEAPTWSQDGEGWTTCYFNRLPDLATVAKFCGGIEDPERGGYVFKTPDEATKVAKMLGQDDLGVDPRFADRKTTLKSAKDGRLVVEIERKKGDDDLKTDPDGWLAKKTKWIRVYEVQTETAESDPAQSLYDNRVRHVETTDGDNAGWRVRKNGKWGGEPYAHAKIMLQGLGVDKTAAEAILGVAVQDPWILVNLPFQDEFPGGRRWNLGAAQFKVEPAVLAEDEAPKHPSWDLIFDHIGNSLTPQLKTLPWASDAGIKTGGDYLRHLVACIFRDPFEPTPYLFLYGPENSGKSIFHEALGLLVTRGIVMADRVLTTKGDFNGELANAILCVVEEKAVSKHPGAMAKIKQWVTCRRLSVRKMRFDSFEQDSTLHWVQVSNDFHACPVFPGDSRITVIEVPAFTGDEIPKKKLLERLDSEASHFLRTILDLQLPPTDGRLRIPVVETEDKDDLAAEMAPVAQFLADCCEVAPPHRIIKKQLYSAYVVWSLENGFEDLKHNQFGEQLMSVSKNQIRAKGQKTDEKGKLKHCYQGVRLKGDLEFKADLA